MRPGFLRDHSAINSENTMTQKPSTPSSLFWKLLSAVLFPFGNEMYWEPGTMPEWRKTAGMFWFGFVVLPTVLITAGWAFFEVFPSGGGSPDDGRDATCFPSTMC